MKAKDIASQLGGLAASISSQGSYDTSGIDADLPEELLEPDPLFVTDHEAELKNCHAKALRSVKQIVNSIVPKAYQKTDIITDKIVLDGDLLGQLYYQQSMNNIMIKVIMDTIAKGDTSAKLFDSYTRLISSAKDFIKQINEMQNQFRKYYIDTYLDMQHKEDEDLIAEENGVGQTRKTITNNKQEPLNVSYEPADTPSNMDRRETSTKDTVLRIQEWKKQQYKLNFLKQKEEENK